MEGKAQKLLLIEESPLGRGTMDELLHACNDQDFELHKALDLQSAKRVLQHENISIVLLDLSGKKDCENSIKKIYELVDHIPIIVVSNKNDAEFSVNAARNGAQEYLSKKNLSSELLIQTLFSAIERKRIERELRMRGAILEAISFAAEKFLNNPDWKSFIHEVLQKLGQASQSDRAYIFESKLDKDKRIIPDLVGKWVAPGIGRCKGVSEMQEHSDQKIGYQRRVKILQKGEIIHAKVSDLPPQEQISLKGLNIQSLLVVPITVENNLWGIMGFDQCNRQRTWAQLEIEALKTAAGIVAAAISRSHSDAYIKHLATHDCLTDLPNRALFEDRLQQAMARADRSAKWVALMVIDLDYFKKVNDSYGHPVGDQVLIQIGKRLITAVRTSDTVARIGGMSSL